VNQVVQAGIGYAVRSIFFFMRGMTPSSDGPSRNAANTRQLVGQRTGGLVMAAARSIERAPCVSNMRK
jgi:hypothetical protein